MKEVKLNTVGEQMHHLITLLYPICGALLATEFEKLLKS